MAANEAFDTRTDMGAADLASRRRADYGEPTSSPTALLRSLVNDIGLLFRKEIALASSEIMHAVDDAKKGAASMVTGGAVLYAGLLFLLVAAMLALSLVVAGWLAALIVGGITVLAGYIMLQSGKKQLEAGNLKPQRAIDSLRKDADTVRRQTP
jgi:hypothetical protein